MAKHRVFYKTRSDGVNLFRTYSDETPTLKQLPTNTLYDCWVYKLDKDGNETNEVDWDLSGVIDVENTSYTYVEVEDNGATSN